MFLVVCIIKPINRSSFILALFKLSKAENALEVLSRRLIKLQCVCVLPYISTMGLICILYLYVKTINGKIWHDLKKSKEEYTGRFGGIKGKEKMMQIYYKFKK